MGGKDDMKIEIAIGTNRDELAYQEMFIDGNERLGVYPLNECPEDAIIGRGLVSCSQIAEFMREAYEAGKRGEEFTVTEQAA
jgi:hypothetical protein